MEKEKLCFYSGIRGFCPTLPKRGSGMHDTNGLESLLPYITRQTWCFW